MAQSSPPFGLGALLYSPANSTTLAPSLLEAKIPGTFSMGLCLEDTISPNHVEEAVDQLCATLATLHQSQQQENPPTLPPIYIRVRSPQQIEALYQRLGDCGSLVTGIIAPKITPRSVGDYVGVLGKIAPHQVAPWQFLPILESGAMIDLRHRASFLYEIRDILREISPLIASVRVGGNDLCHCFGLRRDPYTTIHQIPVISHLFSDIMAVFGQEYPISGAVWEYYDGPHWQEGLARELAEDRAFGFLGKTVIHPKQIPLVHAAYRVSATDYKDACAILNWDENRATLVEGNQLGQRMNEPNTHHNWARRVLLLAESYGQIEEEE